MPGPLGRGESFLKNWQILLYPFRISGKHLTLPIHKKRKKLLPSLTLLRFALELNASHKNGKMEKGQ